MSVLFSRREENAIITRNIKKKNFQYFFNSHSEADKTYLKNKINSSLNFLIILHDEKKKSLSELSNKIIQLEIDSKSLDKAGLVDKAIEKRRECSKLTKAQKILRENIKAHYKDILDFTRETNIIKDLISQGL
jgi:hypothetical protein